jgi:hypothetical protein
MISSLQRQHGATAFLRLGVKDLDLKSETIERLAFDKPQALSTSKGII